MERIPLNRTLSRQQQLSGTLFVLIAAFGFSAKAIIIKLGYQHSIQIDPISFMVLRMAMALPFFLVTTFWLNKGIENIRLEPRDWSARLILFLYPTLALCIRLGFTDPGFI